MKKIGRFAAIVMMSCAITKYFTDFRAEETGIVEEAAQQIELEAAEEDLLKELNALAFKKHLYDANQVEISDVLFDCKTDIIEHLRKDSFSEPYIIDEYSPYHLIARASEKGMEKRRERIDNFLDIKDKHHALLNLTYNVLTTYDTFSGIRKEVVTATCVLDDRQPDFEILSILVN